ncbi:MAG: TolC family protein [Thiobacillus sp.]|nr:TolC family protein [Thiobacillus sp.]
MRSVLLIFAGLLLVHPACAVSLRAALDQAWETSPQAQTLEAKRAESEAQTIAANSLLPGAPAVILAHRGDQLTNNDGLNEWEAGIALPIWLPGQRDARQRQAQTGKDGLEAGIRALRLTLAGELREAIGQLRQAQAQIQLDEARALTAKKLADDVTRRERAGELARTDLNLAQNEWRAAQAAVFLGRTRLLQAQQAYATLTGTAVLPDDMTENALPKPLPDDHPLLEAARQAIATAQAQVRLANESRRDNPELGFSVRQERGSLNDPYAGSVEVSLRLPLATDARNLPLTSAAQTALADAQSQYQRTRLTLEFQLQQAEQALLAADQLLELAQQQRTAAQENLGLIQKSFDLGETDLFTLLRARAAAFEAGQACNQQEIALALARARLNQAQGILP